MPSTVERLTGVPLREQAPAFLMMLGHAGTHWITGAFYILLPFIARDLDLSYIQVGQLAAVLHVSSFLANAFSGVLIDLTGRRVVVQTLALMFNAAAMMAFAITHAFVALAALIAVIGVSVNVWHPAAISFLSHRYPNSRGYAMSVHVLGANLGDAAAPLMAGALLGWLSWRMTSVITAAPTVAIAVVIAMVLMSYEREMNGSEAKNKDRMSFHQYLSALRPVIRDRLVIGLCLTAGFRSLTLIGVFTFLPLYLSDVLHMEPFWMGVTLTAMQIGGVISSPIAGAWSDRAGRRQVLLAGLTLCTVAIVALIAIGNGALLMAGVSALGFALFGVRGVLQSWMMETVPPSLGGTGTSLLFGTQSAMAALAPLIGGAIADAWGVGAVFYLLAASILVANVIVLFIPRESSLKNGNSVRT